jgi:proteic killer suppression protein
LYFSFASARLKRIYETGRQPRNLPRQVVDSFFDVMAMLAAIQDESELCRLVSLHYEKLAGDRAGQHSVRLWQQWRLCFTIERDKEGKYLRILEIVDYH